MTDHADTIPMPHASTIESMGQCVFCGLPMSDGGPCEKRPRPGSKPTHFTLTEQSDWVPRSLYAALLAERQQAIDALREAAKLDPVNARKRIRAALVELDEEWEGRH